jgi:hypothetical protein
MTSGTYKVDELGRECYCCGSKTTYVDKTGRRHWVLNHDIATGRLIGVLCRYCFSSYIWNKSEWMRDYQSRRMRFKGPYHYCIKTSRTGVCQLCGRRGTTHIHHTKYDHSDPLAFTIEVCPRCHIRLRFELGPYSARWKEGQQTMKNSFPYRVG